MTTLLSAAAARGAAPATQPAANLWNAKLFGYEKPARRVIEEATPTLDQLNFYHRPHQMPANAPDPVAPTGPVQPVTIRGVSIIHLRFKDAEGEIVPALLCTPADKPGPFPVVVAVHGLRSNKAQVCAQVAPSLTALGFAVLAPDLPLHGERPGDPSGILDRSHLPQMFQRQHQAIMDVRETIDVAELLPRLDTSKGITLVGYSMGSWVDSVVGAADDRVKSMVLMVGGATDIPAAALLMPQIAAVDPRLAITHFAGRPLLMLNGRHDPIVTPEMSKRLFAAAPDPKKQIWYDSGHLLPMEAYADAADWVAQTWKQIEAGTPRPAVQR